MCKGEFENVKFCKDMGTCKRVLQCEVYVDMCA